ncbi:hypothetical protein ACOMHN_060742 [Nucella lapillus]
MHLLTAAVLCSIAVLHLSAAAVSSDILRAGSSSRHKRNFNSKVDLDALKDNLASFEDDITSFQKRSCAVGLNSHHCAIAHMDDFMMGKDYLSGGFSPGKRSTELPDDLRMQAEILVQNLSEQQQAVRTLRSLLSKIGARSKQQDKRTCMFRLGNHCLTEALDRAANQYYYLQSPLSPGRRRRQAGQGSRVQSSARISSDSAAAERR